MAQVMVEKLEVLKVPEKEMPEERTEDEIYFGIDKDSIAFYGENDLYVWEHSGFKREYVPDPLLALRVVTKNNIQEQKLDDGDIWLPETKLRGARHKFAAMLKDGLIPEKINAGLDQLAARYPHVKEKFDEIDRVYEQVAKQSKGGLGLFELIALDLLVHTEKQRERVIQKRLWTKWGIWAPQTTIGEYKNQKYAPLTERVDKEIGIPIEIPAEVETPKKPKDKELFDEKDAPLLYKLLKDIKAKWLKTVEKSDVKRPYFDPLQDIEENIPKIEKILASPSFNTRNQMETELVDREFHGGWARHYEKEKKKGRRRKNIDELLKSWKAGSERAKNRILELCTGVTEDEFTPSICRTSRISIDGVETEADYDFDDLGENDYE